jgi:hypothetical protein
MASDAMEMIAAGLDLVGYTDERGEWTEWGAKGNPAYHPDPPEYAAEKAERMLDEMLDQYFSECDDQETKGVSSDSFLNATSKKPTPYLTKESLVAETFSSWDAAKNWAKTNPGSVIISGSPEGLSREYIVKLKKLAIY